MNDRDLMWTVVVVCTFTVALIVGYLAGSVHAAQLLRAIAEEARRG